VTQLCPAIVVGRSTDGTNHGDTKVCNAPLNAFGRVHKEQLKTRSNLKVRLTSWLVRNYPADPNALINIVPVDRVVQGMIHALHRPQSVGQRVHLGTDNHLSSAQITEHMAELVGVRVKLTNPALYRYIRDPLIAKFMTVVGMSKMMPALRRLTEIFAAYSEWGQPVHLLGNDVSVLGLPPKRPWTSHVLKMVIPHNELVQEFGKVRGEEVFRREREWEKFCADLLAECKAKDPTIEHLGALDQRTFRRAAEQRLSWPLIHTQKNLK